MWKEVGLLCVVLGSTLFGMLEVWRMKLHLRHLSQVQQFFSCLHSAVCYSRSTLAEACGESAKYIEEPFATFLRDVACKSCSRDGKGFSQIWEEAIETEKDKWALTREELDRLTQFGKQSGFSDWELQGESIHRMELAWQRSMEEVQEGLGQRKKITICLTFAVGMIVAILLV